MGMRRVWRFGRSLESNNSERHGEKYGYNRDPFVDQLTIAGRAIHANR
jgi:hypothetical protein